MLKHFQILFFVLVGCCLALAALRSHFTDSFFGLFSLVGLMLAYLGFISRILSTDQHALLVRFSRRITAFLLGSVVRTTLSLVTTIILLSVLGYSFWWHTFDVKLVIHPEGKPALSNETGVQFQITYRLENEEPVTFPLKPFTTRSIGFAPIQYGKSVSITAAHKEYNEDDRSGFVKALATELIQLKPSARPALVVRVHRDRRNLEQPDVFSVKAWRAGKNNAKVEKKLNESGNAVFVTDKSWYWLVHVVDGSTNRFHRSPAIQIDRSGKTYSIDLSKEKEFEWHPSDSVDPQKLERLVLAGGALHSTVGLADVNEGAPLISLNQTVADKRPSRDVIAIRAALPLGAPSEGLILGRAGYVISYNPQLKVPNWVAYPVDAKDAPILDGRPRYAIDPDLNETVQSTRSDYSLSGYDRGQLVSNMDMKRYGRKAMREAQYLSAVAPQTPVLNRGTWWNIEREARRYSLETGEIVYVTAGPAFIWSNNIGDRNGNQVLTIGNGVAVPTHFFRIHMRLENGRPKVIGFLVPNDSDLDRDPGRYIVSLATIEKGTGLRFFPEASDEHNIDRNRVPAGLWTDR